MSNIPITSLPGANPLTGEETVPIVQAGTTKKTTTGNISAIPFGSAVGSVSGISFVTVGSFTAALPSSRILSATSPVLLTDGGAGGALTIGLSFTPGTGTVTSVGLDGGTTGLTISNSPITTAGTMTLGGVLNVSAGGVGTSTLATASVLLGNGINPVSNVTNATAGYVLTATGLTTAPTFQPASSGSGTVTSVALSNTVGLTVGGSPITANGTLTLSGFLFGTAIATSSITATQIATATITSTQIAANGVGTTQLAANSVLFAKFQQVTGLSVVGVSGTATADTAAITGTAGQTLTVNAGGTALAFGRPVTGYSVIGLQGSNNAGSGASKYDFTADAVVLAGTSSAFYFSSTGTTTVDVLLSGPVVNGRDQSAAFTTGQYLHYYWITNGTTLGLTVSSTAPPTGPTLPSGYKAWAYAAGLFYASTTAIASTYISGSEVFYKSRQVSLLNGNATTITAVSVASFVPPNAVNFTLNAAYIGVLTSAAGGSAAGTVHWSIDGVNDYTTSVYSIVGFPSGFSFVPLTDLSLPNVGRTYYYYSVLTSGSSPAVTTNVVRYKVPNGG